MYWWGGKSSSVFWLICGCEEPGGILLLHILAGCGSWMWSLHSLWSQGLVPSGKWFWKPLKSPLNVKMLINVTGTDQGFLGKDGEKLSLCSLVCFGVFVGFGFGLCFFLFNEFFCFTRFWDGSTAEKWEAEMSHIGMAAWKDLEQHVYKIQLNPWVDSCCPHSIFGKCRT